MQNTTHPARPVSRRIQSKLLLLFFVLLIPTITIQVFAYWDRYETRRSEALHSNLELARAISKNFIGFIKDILHQEMALGLALTTGALSDDVQDQILSQIHSQYPAIWNISWAGPDGLVKTSSNPAMKGLDLHDREYFKSILAGGDWTISDLVISKITQQPMFTINLAFRSATGELKGVIVAGILAERLDEVIGVQRSPGEGFSIIDSKGMLVCRYPQSKMSLEERDWAHQYPSIREALKGKEVSAEFFDPYERKDWLVGICPVFSIGWAVSAGTAEDEVMAGIHSKLILQSFIFLIITFIFLASAVLASRPLVKAISKMRDHALAIGKGQRGLKISVRGPIEIEELAEAINTMGEAILAQESELRKSHEELEFRIEERTSELKTYMAKLEQSNQTLQDFASIASHDLQEPLRKVTTFGKMLKSKCGAAIDGVGEDYLNRMLSAAGRMQTLLRDLLEFSRVSTQAQPFIEIELSEIVREVLCDLEVGIETTGAVVKFDNLPRVHADPTQMRQLFQNLIGNALKFRKESEKPAIEVSSSADDDTVEISVQDNGIGFDEQYLHNIFAPFQRIHGRSSRYEGTGMGLAICKKIVERHGGSITAKSSPGAGSKFIVTLPLDPARNSLN